MKESMIREIELELHKHNKIKILILFLLIIAEVLSCIFFLHDNFIIMSILALSALLYNGFFIILLFFDKY